MQPLGLADDHNRYASVEQLEEGLRNATRAQELLDSDYGSWWVELHRVAEGRLVEKMLKTGSDTELMWRAQGGVLALRAVVRELEYMAAQRVSLEEALNDRRNR